MQTHSYIHRVINKLDPAGNLMLNMTLDDAVAMVASGDAEKVAQIDGQFAICAQVDRVVRMARSIGRPLRYFLAKKADGPCLIVAESMEQIREVLRAEGLLDQFHPSYTRMVPAHHLVQIELVGCPDPNPRYDRFFTPERNSLPPDLDQIGKAYIVRLSDTIDAWLDRIPKAAPIGVMFSGGVDSGAVFLATYDRLLRRGESPARLKAFTLSIDGITNDSRQAVEFLQSLDLEMFLEVIDVPSAHLNWRTAIHVIEDYKPLDVQSATMALALCREIRRRYPDWQYLIDGDGGDENLKDYPIEDNPELTIRSVLNNLMLYQEGWGVHAIKHSLVHSGGQSRGHIRTSATAKHFGFIGFSPFATTRVIEVAEGIPFIELTNWDHQKLYALKGEIVARGIHFVTGMSMPTYDKRRFQHGAMTADRFNQFFPSDELPYRNEFQRYWQSRDSIASTASQ